MPFHAGNDLVPQGGTLRLLPGGAGIDVIATGNIQRLESIADEVEQMTGARSANGCRTGSCRKADQIELIDSSPEQLRRRRTVDGLRELTADLVGRRELPSAEAREPRAAAES